VNPPADEESTTTVSPSLVHLQPRDPSILHAANASGSAGQLCMTLVPQDKNEAASSGSALLFAPCTLISPSILLPPSMISLLSRLLILLCNILRAVFYRSISIICCGKLRCYFESRAAPQDSRTPFMTSAILAGVSVM